MQTTRYSRRNRRWSSDGATLHRRADVSPEAACHASPLGDDCDPRLRALFDALTDALPVDVAAERARNAATSLILYEELEPDAHVESELKPRQCITWALRDAFVMREHPISDAVIERAIAAWLGA